MRYDEPRPNPPAPDLITNQVRTALAEDLGTGDITAALISDTSTSRVEVVCRDDAVLCGVPWFNEVFAQLGGLTHLEWSVEDGSRVIAGQTICRLSGKTRTLLSGERTALNYIQLLSGTASRARLYADAVAGTGVKILDTRKTLPGLRLQQKYAVVCGGCHNHRIGLYDAILIKENHVAAAGSIAAALAAALQQAGPGVEIEIEVESLDELKQALDAGARRVLLDNFDLQQLREAVGLTRGRARLEASGGVSLQAIRDIAETGVDDISVGALTKDVSATDLSMRFV